ncbi:MAG: serine/threonine protein kinase, partial [Trinickia sp.]
SSTLTLAGAMIGTPSYMSPEQCAGEAIDGRSDLFSAAIVLYQMLTGRRLFVGASHVQVMQQLMHETPLAPSARNPSLPSALDGVVLRALSRSPVDRFQTADALRTALVDALQGALPMSTEGRTVEGDDCTLLEARTTRPAGSLGSGTGAWSTPGSESGASLSSLTMWPAALLGSVQAQLAEQIGPVARLLVRRAAARIVPAPDLPALIALLAPHVPSDKGREQFVRAFAQATGTGSMHGIAPSSLGSLSSSSSLSSLSSSSLSTDEVRAAARKLAVYLGPIAIIVAKREATRVSDLRMLHERLALAISNERDRASFKRDVGL